MAVHTTTSYRMTPFRVVVVASLSASSHAALRSIALFHTTRPRTSTQSSFDLMNLFPQSWSELLLEFLAEGIRNLLSK